MWTEFRIALSFLTTLPLKYKGEWNERDFSRAAIFYPLVGLIIGVAVGGAMALFSLTGYFSLAAFAGLALSMMLSGGLHLDGFMDMCDGLLAYRGRERALEIMKDSRVGSFSVLGVFLLLLGKFVLYENLMATGTFFFTLVIAFTFSRFALVCCLLIFPSAREQGLGVVVKRHVSKSSLWFGLILIIGLLVLSRQWPLILALILSALFIFLLTYKISRFLEGITGDILGAMAELSEFVFLLIALLFASLL